MTEVGMVLADINFRYLLHSRLTETMPYVVGGLFRETKHRSV
ncbi:MAG: hypothetical protein AB2535_18725 [Candidatus Thiodiazotropha endolucinida]